MRLFPSRRSWRPKVVLVAAVLSACGPAPDPSGESETLAPVLEVQDSRVNVRLQAVSAASERVVWASGLGGTFVRSLDGGESWAPGAVEGADQLELRDVHAFDAERALLLAAGPGDASRIYRTLDGGGRWEEVFRNPDPDGFYNCFTRDDAGRFFLVGDALAGRMPLWISMDDGASWELLPADALPEALPGEAGFSASGTCVAAGVIASRPTLLVGTGGAGDAAFHAAALPSEGRVASLVWSRSVVPIPASGSSAGVTSLALRADGPLATGGGDVAARTAQQETMAVWQAGESRTVASPEIPGAVFGLAWAGDDSLWAVGPGGLAVSTDAARSWLVLGTESLWAVSFAPSGVVGWAVGPEGRIVRLRPSG